MRLDINRSNAFIQAFQMGLVKNTQVYPKYFKIMKRQYRKIELSYEAVLYEARYAQKEKSDSKNIKVGVIGEGQVCSRYFNIMFQLRS